MTSCRHPYLTRCPRHESDTSLIPLGLRVQTQHCIGQRRRVLRHVRRGVLGLVLNIIQDLQYLFLNKADEHEVDGSVVRHVGWVGADVVGGRVVRKRCVEGVVTSVGASLCKRKYERSVQRPRNRKRRRN